MHILSLDMYQTLALAVGVLYLGMFLKKRIRFLEKFCIPSPVIGGLIFALLSLGLYCTGIVEFVFDETLKTVCMVIFFTSVGFQANLRILKSGGVSLVIFLVCVIVLILGQRFSLCRTCQVHGTRFAYSALAAGPIPMVGGHGQLPARSVLSLNDLGVSGATTLCTAAATFGLVAGSLIGGPWKKAHNQA